MGLSRSVMRRVSCGYVQSRSVRGWERRLWTAPTPGPAHNRSPSHREVPRNPRPSLPTEVQDPTAAGRPDPASLVPTTHRSPPADHPGLLGQQAVPLRRVLSLVRARVPRAADGVPSTVREGYRALRRPLKASSRSRGSRCGRTSRRASVTAARAARTICSASVYAWVEGASSWEIAPAR